VKEIHQQTIEAADFSIRVGRQNLLRHLDPLDQREERPLRLALGDADDHPVEEATRTPNEILMAACHRIKGAGIDCHSPIQRH